MSQIKFKANHIYTAVNAFTGISQSTVDAALNGDKGAADHILKFSETSQARAANAETIFGALSEGVEATGQLVQEESKFLKSASGTLKGVQSAIHGIEMANTQYMHASKEYKTKHDYKLRGEITRHRRTLNLMGTEHRTNEELAGMNDRQQRLSFRTQIDDARKQIHDSRQTLSPRQQALDSLQRVGGASSNLHEGLGSMIGKVFSGLFR